MNKQDLLRALYQAIQWDRLYELLPEVSRQEVDEFFQELRTSVAEAAEPEPDAAASIAGGDARLYCDGSSRGNPGPAGIGMVITTPEDEELLAWGASIGRATNNVAEYRAIVEGLKKALALKVRRVHVFCDSELVVRQVQGNYKVKSPGLKPLYAEVIALLTRFELCKIQYIPRHENAKADALAIGHAKTAEPGRQL